MQNTIYKKQRQGTNLESVKIKGMAKVNLGLDVLRRRPDGYHDVKMIMQTVNIFDELELAKSEENTIKITCDTAELPCDDSNLIYKAARLLFAHENCKEGVSIHLHKNIPIAAGMAGGSTDAAATLLGLNELFAFGKSKKELAEIGVKIGADVPYCIYGGTCLSEGIGEILTTLPAAPDCFVVVAKPHIGVSTKYVYENLHADTLQEHPDIDGMIEAIKENDIKKVADKMENVLETVTVKKYPEIEKLKSILLENGALNALMSGSGPTVFGLFTDKDVAKKALEKVEETGLVAQGFVTEFAKETGLIG